MNEISTLITFVVNHFKSNKLVNTISTLPTDQLDINKENIYPLVNIDLVNSTISYPDADMLTVNFLITVLQQRDIIPEVIDNKLLLNTNWIDNMNECHSISNKFITNLLRQNNDENIFLDSSSAIVFLNESYTSGLDGNQFNINLSLRNLISSCIDEEVI